MLYTVPFIIMLETKADLVGFLPLYFTVLNLYSNISHRVKVNTVSDLINGYFLYILVLPHRNYKNTFVSSLPIFRHHNVWDSAN